MPRWPLTLRPLNHPRELSKALGLDASALVRASGWRKDRGWYHLRVVDDASDRLQLPAGVYRSRSLGGCMIPAATAMALADEGRVEWQLIDPDAAAMRATEAAISAAGGAGSTDETAVVAVLAHVDHGKTTLLDTLLGTSVAMHEQGMITQSVRPSRLRVPSHLRQSDSDVRSLAFLDTPGHQVFGGMRAAAERSADLRLVLVALDAGVQAQTREVLRRCARAKGPTLLALTKLDLALDGSAKSLEEARSCRRVAAATAEIQGAWAEEVAAADQEMERQEGHSLIDPSSNSLEASMGQSSRSLKAQHADVSLLCALNGWGINQLIDRILETLRSGRRQACASQSRPLESREAANLLHSDLVHRQGRASDEVEPSLWAGLASRANATPELLCFTLPDGGTVHPSCVAVVLEVIQMKGHGEPAGLVECLQ